MLSKAPIKRVGFTGTKKGLSEQQADTLENYVRALSLDDDGIPKYDVEVHHGDCINGDETFHSISYDHGHFIVIHPPLDVSRRAWCSTDKASSLATSGNLWVKWRDPYTYHVRNQHIVDETEFMIACPFTMHETQRSGTWSTVRKARAQNKMIVYIYPDGSIEIEGSKNEA